MDNNFHDLTHYQYQLELKTLLKEIQGFKIAETRVSVSHYGS